MNKKAKLNHPEMNNALSFCNGNMLSSRMASLVSGLAAKTLIVSSVDGQNVTSIATHDGSFHCDEALAVSMLKLLPRYQDSVVVRTRNPDILSQCNIVVDVGATYVPETHRYDHHQREFTGVLEGYDTKLSSAGLVYKHFGKEILRHIYQETGTEVTDELIDVCFHKLYKGFIEHIDAIDNGVSIVDGASPKYHVSSTLGDRIHALNPAWNEVQSKELYNERFSLAVQLASSEFLAKADALTRVWWPARHIVHSAVADRLQWHPTGKLIVFSQCCPWKDHLFELEESLKVDPIIYALYEDSGGSWRIQAVPVEPNSFHSRKKLPDEWCGLREEALSEKCGVSGAIFIHASGFIGGHRTFEGALQMAKQALDM